MFLIKNIRSRTVDMGRCTTSNLYRTIRVFKKITQYKNYKHKYNYIIML